MLKDKGKREKEWQRKVGGGRIKRTDIKIYPQLCSNYRNSPIDFERLHL